jgi:RND family efflux transporter MFP subunit
MTPLHCIRTSSHSNNARRSRAVAWFCRSTPGLLISCVAFGCAGKPTPKPEELPPAPVQLATVQEVFMGEWTELIGATQPLPNHSARITAAVEGRVVWLLKDPDAKNGKPLVEGQKIEKGQVLGKLDDRLVRANLGKLKTSQEETEQQKIQSQLAVKSAQIDFDNLLTFQTKPSTTSVLPGVNKTQLDKAEIALNNAKSKQTETEAKLEGIKDELKALEEQLDLFVLKSPITGRLGSIQVVPGQTLAIGATVAEVVDLDDVDVLCFVPPSTASKLALGQPVRLATDAEDEKGSGKIEFISVQAQPDTGMFAVKSRFPNGKLQLRSGSVVRIEALTKPRQPRITIDASALLEDQDPPSVVILRGELEEKENEESHKIEKLGTVRKVNAKIGIRDRRLKRVEIFGLEDPESKAQLPLDGNVQFVVKGGQGLEGDAKEGDKVKLEEDED